ncbi:MAG: 50S ribosomal protein L24 [Candidatus Niyogibacteria bacterium RIFCSPLOWO2_01_FULL_45_48]|uniref:Large ribosomal subunit protein uL24 n=2 Tax=Candidatus Niyogiibacteriota TaxID=1817912 RepID=A0A1G2F0S4_9BACT|nr:MAG: 50S ribosomal protein L24 [Candidatus Niyogibacteria bacterium RIFCSPHIGHO2_01_FULL_45_28]OGZ30737.1 MAG: 50S ribosomal protein L24 [Candidatus Niyogibacteria bacterium RIFCSPLOWO2_01_FULL_45_48]OGZ31178.1 MAG: 50S ribosomal protein L24 [Candidatus Niyogibacteria bacterium RIFCSPLOWO2_02_FULL_45_13]
MAHIIKKNDSVKILSGKNRGSVGKVLRILSKEGKVVVEGVNIIKKHRRPRRQGEKGQVVQMPSPVHFSNVMLVCPSCSKPNRVKIILDPKGRKSRVCRRCLAGIS